MVLARGVECPMVACHTSVLGLCWGVLHGGGVPLQQLTPKLFQDSVLCRTFPTTVERGSPVSEF